jgi:hypothetical protein
MTSTRGSPVLWRLLLELEIRAGDLDRAKNILLQAIGACPLVKGTCMFAHINDNIAKHTTKTFTCKRLIASGQPSLHMN